MLRLVFLFLLLFVRLSNAQVFDEQYDHWPEKLKINGRIIIIGDSELNRSARQAMFSNVQRELSVICRRQASWQKVSSFLEAWRSNPEKNLITLSVFDDFQGFGQDSKAETKSAIAFISDAPLSQTEIKNFRKLKPTLAKKISDGGWLIVDNHFAPLLGSAFRNSDGDIERGLNLFCDSFIQTDFVEGENRDELMATLATVSPSVGVCVESDCWLMLDGRLARCFGNGSAAFALPQCNKYLEEQFQKISQRQSRRQPPDQYLIDLTQWRRGAIDRRLPQFPLDKPEQPNVKNGSLIIVGGGGMPSGLMQKMVDLAGGVDKAKMVFVPCSSRDDVGQRHSIVELWKRMGVKHTSFIHTKDRRQANSDENFFEPLKDATGIWFGGGRQWNFADSYYGTKTHQLMKAVLQRGGVIGGSSAGASVQGRYLARATPIGNYRIMAPGYERGGLGFLSGVAIDQHFSQRNRQKDMTELVNRYPQLLGIGIDEATAIIVQKSQAKIVGRGNVYFYDRRLPVIAGEDDFIALSAGAVYDLTQREIVANNNNSAER